MRTPALRAALLPAMVLAAVLTAGAGTARAGDGVVPPLPGADVGEATESAPSTPLAEPGTDATPEEAGSDSPASGSRLLRALAEAPKAPARWDDVASGAVPLVGPRVYAAEGCPRALLRRLLAGAVDGADALTALAIEREALTLCRERQEIVAGLFETEARLAELRAPVEAPVPAPVVAEAAAPQTPAVVPAKTAPVSPLRAALAGKTEAAKEEEPPPPSYGWFSIIGMAGALRAGITDGEAVWFVRTGDPLPDGGTVAAIEGRPPGVRLALPGGEPRAGDRETPLPFKARPGGGP